ncbi:hypothetical protein L0Y59_00775 [Candidatus Uhrbacteria bacterium]|nr:hypothetical protein [Candidatus Uhrbacteria bacterium]
MALTHGPQTYVSRDRVLLYLMFPDVRDAQQRHRYRISMKRIRQVAETFGDVVHAVACVDAQALEDARLYNSLVINGYAPLAVLGTRRSREEVAKHIQNPAPLHLLRDAKHHAVQTAVIVATGGLPSWVFPELKALGVSTVVIAPDPTCGIRPSHADEWIPLQKVSDEQPLPPRRYEEHEEPIQRYFADIQDGPTHEMEWLARHDPESYAWLERVLTVTEGATDVVLRSLTVAAADGSLPAVAFSALLVLSDFPDRLGAERRVRKNAFYHKLTRFGIDVDTVGRLTLTLLAEEGSLLAERRTRDTEYAYARDARHPVHVLSRAFYAGMTRNRNRAAFVSVRSAYADEVLEAFEIFAVDPKDLTPDAAKDICDFVSCLLCRTSSDMRRTLRDRGLSDPEDVARFFQRLRDILAVPPDVEHAADPKDDEEDVAPSCDRPAPLPGQRLSVVPKPRCANG